MIKKSIQRWKTILLLLLLASSLAGQEQFTLLSWNIQDFGKSRDTEAITFMANILRNYDIAAIQEVVSGDGGAQAVARLADELNRMGSKWDYRISDPTDSPPYKTERYAFLWKTSKAKLMGRPWLARDDKGIVDREPYLAKFQVKGKTFIVVNFHSRTHKDDPTEEIQTFYAYPQKLPGYPLIIAGDFNTETDEAVFEPLFGNGFSANLYLEKTTLKRKCNGAGEYRNHAIDFMLFQFQYFENLESGIVDFVGDCDNLEKARRISDHLPVWGRFGVLFN